MIYLLSISIYLSTFTITIVVNIIPCRTQLAGLGECSCYENMISVNHFVLCFLIVVASKYKHAYRHQRGRLKQVASLPKYLHWQ